MTLSDPAGLLQRMPELERIALEDAPVRSALGSGDPFKLYRALRWGHWTGRLRAHREQVSELLGNRRLFARPLTGNPSLFTLNSFGAGFVGEDEQSPDGTYITGHYVVILFKLPLLPLGAYVVGPGDNANSYRIFARVPLGGFTWAWSRAAALAAALLVFSGAWGAFQDSRFATVHVANGFSKPLQIELGSLKSTVSPNSTQTLTVPVGAQPARALLEGVVLDEGPINVVSGQDAFLWNVGGVAPLFKVNIDYYANPPTFPAEPKLTLFCGQRVIVERDIDFLFREPDKSVSMSKGVNLVTKVMLSAEWPHGPRERSVCLSWAYLEGNQAAVVSIADALEKAGELTRAEETLPIATSLAALVDEGVWPRAKALLAKRGYDLESLRAGIWAAEETGHLEELTAELNARAAQHPDDPDTAWGVLRAQGSTSLPKWEALLSRFPTHDGARRSVQASALRENLWDKSLSMWLTRLEDDPDEACSDAELIAVPAVKLHKEAQVLEAMELCGPQLGFSTALTAVRLAMSAQQETEPWLGRLSSDQLRQQARLLVGLPADDPTHTRLQAEARFLAAVRRDAASMFTEASTLPARDLQTMEPEMALLVWAEGVRQQQAMAKNFARRSRLTVDERKSFEAFITGAQQELEVKRFTPWERAVAWFVRSRAQGVSPREKERLQKLAREDGLLADFVLNALEHWP